MENGAWRRTLAGILAAAQTAALCLCGGIRAAAVEEAADPAETHCWTAADAWREEGIAAYGGEDIVLPIAAATAADGSDTVAVMLAGICTFSVTRSPLRSQALRISPRCES